MLEHYAATAVATGGAAGGQSLSIDMRIMGYTSDEEALRLVNLLKEKGQSAVVRELDDVDLGNIGASASVGTPLAVVRSFDTPEGKTIRLITVRYMSFLERYFGGRSTDYPFGMVELKVDKEGKGEGRVIAGAKVKVNDEGVLVIESYGNQQIRLLNVRRFK